MMASVMIVNVFINQFKLLLTIDTRASIMLAKMFE